MLTTRAEAIRTRFAVGLVLVVLIAGCASTPPDRIAYNTVTAAVDAVQTAMKGFNDLYQAGKFNDADRAKVIAAYEKFRLVAKGVEGLAETATKDGISVLSIVSAAALEAISVINALKAGP